MAWNVCLAADNEAIQHLFSKTFEGRGDISLKFCESAEETLREIEENPPHLLIVSINLPDKDGYDLCGELKEKGVAFPVLLIEDIFEDIDLDRCLEVQTDGFIAKPFEEDLVAEKVDEVLRAEEAAPSEKLAPEESERLVEEKEEEETPQRLLEEEEVSVSEMVASDEEEDIVELTDLVMEEEATESLEEVPLEEEEEIPPSIALALEESVSELEKMEAMEGPSIPSIEEEEIREAPAAVEPPMPEMDRKEIEEMVAEIVGRMVEKTLEERLPGILKENLARLLSEFSESLK